VLDRIHEYATCLDEPERWAIATVVEVSGSVPRPAGTSMAVRDDARTIGSVSGGCVEGAVVDAALTCLETGEASLHSFGYADDDGLSVGLMCGGDVRVLVQPVREIEGALRKALELAPTADAPGVAIVRELPIGADARGDADAAGTPRPAPLAVAFSPAAGAALPDAVRRVVDHAGPRVEAAVRAGAAHVVDVTDRRTPECPVVRRLLVETRTPAARVIVYGANDYSAALARAAATLDRRVTVCDARPVFATRERHPGAHEVVLMDPAEHFDRELAAGRIDARTAIVVLTHDPRFDLPVLDRALRRGLAYVGAMGSRVTHEKREQELRAGGLGDAELAALHSPIGLDLGARTPAEVAVSILAELVLVEATARRAAATGADPRSTGPGLPRRLRDTEGAVHDARPASASASAETTRPAVRSSTAGPRSCASAPSAASITPTAVAAGIHPLGSALATADLLTKGAPAWT